jgi:hypothetical protein
VDPLTAKYPYNSPYAFSENRVVDGIELEGLEVVALNDDSRNVVLKSVEFMFGANNGFSLENNYLKYNSSSATNTLNSEQQIAFNYFMLIVNTNHTQTTFKANKESDILDNGTPFPSNVEVSENAYATTFYMKSFSKGLFGGEYRPNGIPTKKDEFFHKAQNLILMPDINETTSVYTQNGLRPIKSDYGLTHEWGHAIINTILNDYNGVYNGKNFKCLSPLEQKDWAIRFTNSFITNPKDMETVEYQHGRDEYTRPGHSLAPLKN